MESSNAEALLQFGETIQALRSERGVSLSFVSDKLGISKNHLSLIERGQRSPSDSLLTALAEFYQLDVNELFINLGRIPLTTYSELNAYRPLNELISRINQDVNLHKADRLKLYDQLRIAYESLSEGE